MAAAMASGGRLRTSQADRDHVVDVLKSAFVRGLLTKDEFDMRVAQTFASRTYAELTALTADIPAGLAEAQPLRGAPPHGTPSVDKVVNSCACATLAVLAMSAALFMGNFDLFFFLAAATVGTLFVGGAWMIYSSHAKRSS